MYRRNFLTGCDCNTEWQLPWFLQNFLRWSEVPLMVADFGMSDDMLSHLKQHPMYANGFYVVHTESPVDGWFKKPRAIYNATLDGFKVCWLDTDCQIDGDIASIWKHFEHGKLGMVIDRPWTTRHRSHRLLILLPNQPVAQYTRCMHDDPDGPVRFAHSTEHR